MPKVVSIECGVYILQFIQIGIQIRPMHCDWLVGLSRLFSCRFPLYLLYFPCILFNWRNWVEFPIVWVLPVASLWYHLMCSSCSFCRSRGLFTFRVKILFVFFLKFLNVSDKTISCNLWIFIRSKYSLVCLSLSF